MERIGPVMRQPWGTRPSRRCKMLTPRADATVWRGFKITPPGFVRASRHHHTAQNRRTHQQLFLTLAEAMLKFCSP
jgi:hypothetical protein